MLLDIAPLRRHRDFRLLFFGQFVSFFGSMITYVAVPYQVYQLTSSSLVVGLLGTVQLVPLLLFGLWGGAYADAMDRRRLLIGAEALLSLISLGFAANAMLARPSVVAIFVLTALMSAVNGFHRPTLEAMSPRLVDRDELPATAALTSLRSSLGAIAGPAVGGLCIAGFGLGMTYLLDVATFAVSLVALARMASMPPAAEAAKPGLRSIVEGLDYARRRPELLGTYVVDIVAMTFAMPMALFPAMAERWGGATAAGWLYSAMSIGSLVTTLLSGWTSRIARRGAAVIVAAALWGVAIVTLGYAPNLTVAVLCLALRRRRRHAQRPLPDDDLERDHPGPSARPPGWRRDDQLHDRPAARQRARRLDGVAAIGAVLDRRGRVDLRRRRAALHSAAAVVLALPSGAAPARERLSPLPGPLPQAGEGVRATRRSRPRPCGGARRTGIR